MCIRDRSIPLHFTFSSAVGYDSSVQEAFAARLSHEDPSAALAWAETLPSAEREQAILGVTQAWLRNDREAVEAWLETLPIRDQERILIGLEQDRGRLGRESIDGTPGGNPDGVAINTNHETAEDIERRPTASGINANTVIPIPDLSSTPAVNLISDAALALDLSLIHI